MFVLSSLAAGALGLAAGVPAAALIRRHHRQRNAAQPGRWLTPLLAMTLAGLWAALALRLSPTHPAALPAYLAFGSACVALAVIDARTQLLPNRLTYPAFWLVGALLLVASVVEGDLGRLLRAIMAAAVVGAAFLMLALLLPEGLGLGDVKFVPTLGLALGWLSWGTVVVGMLAAFLLGGLAAVGALLLLRRGRRARLPFGPWLATGALLGVLAGGRLAAWYGHALLGG